MSGCQFGHRWRAPRPRPALRSALSASRHLPTPVSRLVGMSEVLQYLTTEDGKKTAVVLPITEYEKLLEDLDDLAAIAERRDEPTISHEQFKAELSRDGIL
mgnify:CR=1 FL=1